MKEELYSVFLIQQRVSCARHFLFLPNVLPKAKPKPSHPLPRFPSQLPHDEAGDTELRGANAIIMAEGTAALAHDHGFQPAVTFGRGVLHAVVFSEGLNGDGLTVVARVHSWAGGNGGYSHRKGHDVPHAARQLIAFRQPSHKRPLVHVRGGGDVYCAAVTGPNELCCSISR